MSCTARQKPTIDRFITKFDHETRAMAANPSDTRKETFSAI
jgi:hypothetical protein